MKAEARNLKRRLVSLTVRACSALIVAVHAGGAFAYDDKEFGRLLNERNFDEAYKQIQDVESDVDMDLYFHKGMLLGSGLLASGVNRCEAVRNLEKARRLGAKYVVGSLNSIYGGDWAGIAALEGNLDALLEVGRRLADGNPSHSALSTLNKCFLAAEAYPYFRAASALGSQEAGVKLGELESLLRDNGIPIPNHELEFRSIYCPIREQ